MNFGWGGLKPWKNKAEKIAGEFAEKFAAIFLNFAGPNENNSHQIRSARPRHQQMGGELRYKWKARSREVPKLGGFHFSRERSRLCPGPLQEFPFRSSYLPDKEGDTDQGRNGKIHEEIGKISKRQEVLNPTPLHPTPATCHKRKRKLHCNFQKVALQKLHCNIRFSALRKSFSPKSGKLQFNTEKAALQESGAFLPLSCAFQAPTFRLPRLGPAENGGNSTNQDGQFQTGSTPPVAA